MENKITWDEMKKKYPNEWLMIIDYNLDNSGRLTVGVVKRHSKSRAKVYEPVLLNKPVAFRYTGESTFSGLRSHDGE